MNTLPPINCNRVATFLKQKFSADVSVVRFIGEGMFSQAFSFDTLLGTFVIRLNQDDDDFKKDQYAYQNFRAPKLPIPNPVNIGRFGDQHHSALLFQPQIFV
jgi:hypothetical protein